MRHLSDVETPSVLVDLDALTGNVNTMAARAREAGVRLRPHIKTHKVVEIARLQRAAGAAGISVAKTGEAEVFAAAGFEDIFVAYPVVGADKARRLLALSETVRLAVGCDSVEGARTLGAVFAAAGRTLEVMLKVDTGFRRVGVQPAEAAAMSAALAAEPGLRLRGVFTHGGHAYGGETPEAVARTAHEEAALLMEAAASIRARGIEVEEVSVGSTPTARYLKDRAQDGPPGITECRPGNYVYHDASQVALGTCGLEHCALTVLATVVSVPAAGRAVLDAGSKTLSTDPLRPQAGGYGRILGRQSRLDRLSEEHGVIAVAEGESFRVGERVRVLPNHACVVANLHDVVLGIRGETVEAEWPVAARGRVR